MRTSSPRIEKFIEENREQLSTNKHWYGEGLFTDDFIEGSEYCKPFIHAYYDYFNNGGCNRWVLGDAIKAVRALGVIKRGSIASKCLTMLAPYGRDVGFYTPNNMDELYDTILDALGNAQLQANKEKEAA